MKSSTLAIVLFFTFVLTVVITLHANSAKGETAVCSKKTASDADTLRICPSLRVESAIASGNSIAADARTSLHALKDGVDPEVIVPRLASELNDSGFTLADFGVTREDLARAVNRYYARKARELGILALKDDKEKLAAAISRMYGIYEKERAVLIVLKNDFKLVPSRFVGASSRHIVGSH